MEETLRNDDPCLHNYSFSKLVRREGVYFSVFNCEMEDEDNTLGTRGRSRLRDRMLAVQKKRAKIRFFV